LHAEYEVRVDLLRSSAYIDAVAREAAIVNDVENGFYGVVVPPRARRFFRFRDASGRLFHMARLPMGLVSSVELMHTLTKVIVGHPSVCAPQHVICSGNVKADVFIDDFRAVGPSASLAHAADAIAERCERFCVPLKRRLEVVTEYTFLGFAYNHTTREIRVAEKTLRKLPDEVPEEMPAIELQRLIARLIFCAGGLHLPLARFYFAIKSCARLCNDLNNGRRLPNESVKVAASVLRVLRDWNASAREPFNFTPRPAGAHAVLYTDASLSGWGAYLLLPDGRVFINGAHWESRGYTSSDIGMLEAQAVANAVAAFDGLLSQVRNVDIRVDNTSVEAALGSGSAKAMSLNEALANTLMLFRQRGWRYTTSYVRSAENLADAVSRGAEPVKLTCDEAVSVYSRRGSVPRWR
jgi:hypothetical protein